MKKIYILFFSFFLTITLAYTDPFTDIIQDLAIQTACIGQYSATQAGGGWYDDPHDYYTPPMMAERFAKMSENMTRTTTFYGVCFDYAEFAYWDIDKYKNLYIENDMTDWQFFIAGVHSDTNTIILSRPTEKDKATEIQNGVYIKTYGSSSYRNVKTHKEHDGIRATNHAWLWIQRNDGIWFWIDPTWTDNLGYVVYGYVDNGEEIQLKPDNYYCIEYPAYLNNLPSPPEYGSGKLFRELEFPNEKDNVWFTLSRKEICKYNENGIIQFKDITGNGKYFTKYDSRGNDIYSKLRDGEPTTEYVYDRKGNILYSKTTDSFDKSIIEKYMEYDNRGNKIYQKTITEIDGKKQSPFEEEFKYNDKNQLIYEKSNWNEWFYEYDSYGNKIHRTGTGVELFWKYKYDTKGRILYMKDKNSETWYFYGNNEVINCFVYTNGSKQYKLTKELITDNGKTKTILEYFGKKQ